MQTLNLNDLSIHGERILVKLFPYATIESESGILIPKYDNYTTDGGKPASTVAYDKYSTVAEVVLISKESQKLLDEIESPLKVGNQIVVYKNAIHDSNWFILDRSRPVAAHEGYLLIHPNHIQALIHNS